MKRVKIYNQVENTIRYILCSFIILWHSLSGNAQDLSAPFKNYTVKDGLSSNETYCVIEDRKGNIWISTDEGLSRFDGEKFTIYTVSDGLPDNTVFKMYEDYKGRIWLLTYNGKMGFFYNEAFYNINLPEDNISLLYGIQITKDDSVIFNGNKPPATMYGFKLEDNRLKDGSFKKHVDDFSKDHSVRTVTKGQHVYVDMRDHPEKYDNSVFFKKCQFKVSSSIRILDLGSYRFLVVANSFIVVVDEQNKLVKVLKDDRFEKKVYDEDIINISGIGILEDKIFVCRTSGTIKFYDTIPPFNLAKRWDLENISPSYLCKDHFGGLWITTLYKGVYYLPNSELEVFIETDPKTDLFQFARNKYISVISNNRLELKVKKVGNENFGEGTLIDQWNRNPSDIYYDDAHFFINHTFGYSRLDSLGENKVNVPDGFLEYQSSKIGKYRLKKYSCRKSESGLWYSLDIMGIFVENDSVYSNPEMKTARHLFLQNDTAWIGALNGLFAFDMVKKEYIPSVRENPLLHHRIVGIEGLGEDRRILIAHGYGVLLQQGKTTHLINESSGLKWKSYGPMITSDDSTVWLGATKGVSRIRFESFNPLRYHIDNFGVETGFLGDPIYDLYYYGDSIYIATGNKILKLHCEYEFPDFIPSIEFSSVRIGNDTADVTGFYNLPYNQNSIDLTFSIKYYPDADGVTYLYKINEDSTWKVSPSSELNLINLQSGSYTVKLKGRLPNGKETSETEMKILINPPWWKTAWALSLYALAIISIMYVVFRVRLNRAREKETIKRKMAEMELKALRSQMNPHFTFNTMNSIQHFINSNSPDQASAYISRFSKLMRMILDNSREEFVTVDQELTALKLYLEIEKLRLDGKFEYTIEIDDDLDVGFERMPPLVIQPYVENAIWHGLMNKTGLRKLNIKLTRRGNDDSGIYCIVEDNGIGRKKAEEYKSKFRTRHKSHGMNITQTRLELLNEMNNEKLAANIVDLFDEQGAPAGTRVEIFIPTK